MQSAEIYLLEPDDLQEFVSLLLPAADRFIAPLGGLHGDVLFASVDGPQDIELDFGNPIISPVSFVFPSREVLFNYALRDGQPPEIHRDAPPHPRSYSAFGPAMSRRSNTWTGSSLAASSRTTSTPPDARRRRS